MATVINSSADTFGTLAQIGSDGSWSFLGPNFDVAATNIGQVDALHLNLGVSLATTMLMGSSTCVVQLRNKFNVCDTVLPSDAGAVGNYIALQGITTAPTGPISAGYGLLAVNPGDGNLYYFNSTTSYQITPAPPSIVWNNIITPSQSLSARNAYVVNNGASLVTFTLPTLANIGDEFQVQGNGSGGWIIAQNAGQNIKLGNVSSTSGVSGSVASTNQYDVIKLVCTVSNTTFCAQFSVGNLLIS